MSEITTEISISELMARISELEILVTAWQSQAQSANSLIGVLRREVFNERQAKVRAWEALEKERKDRQLERDALIDMIPPAEVPPEAASGKVVSLTERAFDRLINSSNPEFCPQCGMVMSNQCGARCDVCGLKSSCSMEPT